MRRDITRIGVARKQRHQRYSIKSWVDRLPDVPAFIIGNGPSLRDQNLALIEDYFSIGVNRAFYLLDPTILMWQDISLWNTEYHKLHNTQALKVARDVADPRRIYYNFHLKGGPYNFDKTKTHVLSGRGNTLALCTQLSVAIGCRPLILLGADCKLADDGSTDFYGINQFWIDPSPASAGTLANCMYGLTAIKEQCPVEVRNAGCWNDLWPRESLKDILKDIDPKHARGRQYYVKQLLRV